MNFINKIYNFKHKNIFILSLSSAFFLLRSNIPYAIYFFAILQTYLIYKIFKEKGLSLLIELKKSFKYFIAFYLIIVLFSIALIASPLLTQLYSDVLNIIAVFSFISFFVIIFKTKYDFQKYTNYFLLSFLSLFLIYLIFRFFYLWENNSLSDFFFSSASSPYSNFDKNIYTLNIWISIFASIQLLTVNNFKGVQKIIFNLLIFFFLTLILGSASRRGISLLIIISILFLFYSIYKIIFFKKIPKYKTLLAGYILIIFFSLTFFVIPSHYRNLILPKTDNYSLKNKITSSSYRYYHLIFPKTNYKEYENYLWGNNTPKQLTSKQLLDTALHYYSRKNYTRAIDALIKAADKTDSLKNFYNAIPLDIKKMIPDKSVKTFEYLPELMKKTYTYKKFFSCININGLLLKNYDPVNSKKIPFSFSFKDSTAKIKLTLPALSKSDYSLKFQILSKKDLPADIKIIKQEKQNIAFDKIITQNADTIFFTYNFTIKKNETNIIKLHLLLNNNTDSFSISDFRWILTKTNNKEKPEIILSKAEKQLKKFKFEQKRSAFLWRYYLLAEKKTSTLNQKFYNKQKIKGLIDSLLQNVKIRKYVSTKVKYAPNYTNVYFNTENKYARACIDIPALQKAIYEIEMEYEYKNPEIKLNNYIKRTPEIFNVYLKAKIIKDSLIKISNSRYKKIFSFYIDSINNAFIKYVFGISNIQKKDSLTVTNYKIKLKKLDVDSVLLSQAQISTLKKWNKRYAKNDEIVALKKDAEKYKNKSYWQIDSTVYNSRAADRIELWLFAWNYFKALPLKNKIFGDGFNYLKIYKLKFGSKYNATKGFSPHNPLIEATLYSGVLGLIVYMFFLLSTFYYYFKYYKELGVFSFIFIIIFIYSFISGQTPFTIQYWVLFSIFAFVFNYLSKAKI